MPDAAFRARRSGVKSPLLIGGIIDAGSTPERALGRSFLARVIWWRDNFVGVAFSSDTSSELPVSDIEARLRKSEQKKRQLQRRIKELIGEG